MVKIRVLDVKKGDILDGKSQNYEVISNNNGVLYVYGQKTGFFNEIDLTKKLKEDKNMEVFLIG